MFTKENEVVLNTELAPGDRWDNIQGACQDKCPVPVPLVPETLRNPSWTLCYTKLCKVGLCMRSEPLKSYAIIQRYRVKRRKCALIHEYRIFYSVSALQSRIFTAGIRYCN